ncbi:DNA polymerase III alpha subunit [Rhodovulum sp. P5]|nr:DNA polymerase III alpha subunit [Rhodovulum sp. P5]
MRVKKLPDLCRAAGMPAVAVTDTNNMFCALEFSVLASGAGVQPIIGCQVDLAYDPAPQGERARPPRRSCCWRRTRPAMAT